MEKNLFLEHTRAAWQPFTTRELTKEDARQMRVNIVNFFEMLAAWDASVSSPRTRGDHEQVEV